MALSKIIKAAAKRGIKPKAKTKTPTKPAPKKPDTYESEMKAIRNMALTPANRQNRMAKVAVKYGKPIKLAGKVFGPKPKTKLVAAKQRAIRGRSKDLDMFKAFTPTMLNFDKYVKKLRKGQELTKREKIAFVKGALADDKVSIVDGRNMLTPAQFAKIQGLSDEQALKKYNRLAKDLDDY
tara:strand:- start:980 stop:1522 length:543 start_codon:yes stop_codon:yes gene_type:complete